MDYTVGFNYPTDYSITIINYLKMIFHWMDFAPRSQRSQALGRDQQTWNWATKDVDLQTEHI